MQSTRQAPVGTFSPATLGIVAALALAAILVFSLALSGAVRIAGVSPAGVGAAAPAKAAPVAEPYRNEHDTVLAKGPTVTKTFRRGDDTAQALSRRPAPAADTRPRNLRVRSAS